MANEKRLIDANKLKEKLQEHHDFFVYGCGDFSYLTPKDKARVDEITNCIAEITNAPTVDAVEVVRCKDCRYCNEYDILLHRFECRRFLGGLPVRDDDFCSYGRRKDNEV